MTDAAKPVQNRPAGGESAAETTLIDLDIPVIAPKRMTISTTSLGERQMA